MKYYISDLTVLVRAPLVLEPTALRATMHSLTQDLWGLLI